MKPKMISITLSLVIACLLLSGGYGLWEKKLIIRANIQVVDEKELESTEETESITVRPSNTDLNRSVMGEVYQYNGGSK